MLPAGPLRVLRRCARTRRTASARGGAGRVELCARLDVGGTTPARAQASSAASRRLAIPVFVMIRPRGGGFVYDAGEVAAMEADIRMAIAAGAQGLVFGALRPDATSTPT